MHQQVVTQALSVLQHAETLGLSPEDLESMTVNQLEKHVRTVLQRAGVTYVDPRTGYRLVRIEGEKGVRNFQLDSYAEMVVRTSMYAAYNLGAYNQALIDGTDLVRVRGHAKAPCLAHDHPGHAEHPCVRYADTVVSLTGKTPGYPVLKQLPPWHTNCQHWVEPISVHV
jgi:hypothetical protein